MLVSEARNLCKDLVLVDGEDLTPFRDTSKVLFNFLRSYSWNNKAERLGFDEVFMGERQWSPEVMTCRYFSNTDPRCDRYH